MIDVHEFVQVYNFCFDGGGIYTPTERDKSMIEDAINCYVAECEQSPQGLLSMVTDEQIRSEQMRRSAIIDSV